MIEETKRFNVYDYIEGGREGFRDRIGLVVQNKLSRLSDGELREYADYLKEDYSTLVGIANGDYEGLNWRLVNGLCCSFNVKLVDCLGPIIIPESGKKLILEEIRRNRVVGLGMREDGGDCKGVKGLHQKLRLYLALKISHDF